VYFEPTRNDASVVATKRERSDLWIAIRKWDIVVCREAIYDAIVIRSEDPERRICIGQGGNAVDEA
jgi:hypothetical protein